jgi:asparagine synthase (glutamine-hydrolysing)
MCGIAGIIQFDGRPADAEALGRMNGMLAHRGPDGDGFFVQGAVGLAHRRLAIIDPRAGVQPFTNDDRSVVLSYNGEVYNYVELRKELEGEFPFHTQSDTEVVLRAYEKWGIDCLKRFRGMFALAIYDRRNERVYLVRDRVGIKPVFYHNDGRRLLFSSEVASLLASGDVPREVDPAALSGYFRYQYVPAPATIYRGVRKLEPGHYLEIDPRGGRVRDVRYWRLDIKLTERPEGEWIEELEALLRETVKIYVRSDVPFGAFLSGGVDSSLVTALMTECLPSPVRTFTIGFREEKHSEIPYAAQAARILGTEHCERIVSPELAGEILPMLATHFGEPFADSSAIPCYYVSREAAGEVKMVLSGDGGDELFGGYVSYQTTFGDLARERPRLPAVARRLLDLGIVPPALRRWAAGCDLAAHQERHDASRQIFRTSDLRALLAAELAVAPPTPFEPAVSGSVDPVNWFEAQDFTTYLVDDVLTKVDRTSMANSLEVRVPLLDHKVVELAFRMPLSMKLRTDATGALQTKYALKRVASRYFSPAFLARPKQGFGIPVIEWCRGALRPHIEGGLRDRSNPIYQWLRPQYVQDLLDSFYAGQDGLVARLWFLFTFDLWHKHIHRAPWESYVRSSPPTRPWLRAA